MMLPSTAALLGLVSSTIARSAIDLHAEHLLTK